MDLAALEEDPFSRSSTYVVDAEPIIDHSFEVFVVGILLTSF